MRLKSPTDKPVHVALTDGTAITIGPGGRDVPVGLRKAAFAKGCIPANAKAEDMAQEVAEPTEKDRPEILRDALKKLRDDGTPLTGAGLPNRNVVSARAGWNVSAVELTDAWNSM